MKLREGSIVESLSPHLPLEQPKGWEGRGGILLDQCSFPLASPSVPHPVAVCQGMASREGPSKKVGAPGDRLVTIPESGSPELVCIKRDGVRKYSLTPKLGPVLTARPKLRKSLELRKKRPLQMLYDPQAPGPRPQGPSSKKGPQGPQAPRTHTEIVHTHLFSQTLGCTTARFGGR